MTGSERILPFVSRKLINRVTGSLNDEDMKNEFKNGSPLSIWLSSRGLHFFMGGYVMKRLLITAASEQKMPLTDPSLHTIDSYIQTLTQRRQKLLDKIQIINPQLNDLKTLRSIGEKLKSEDSDYASISEYDKENRALMDFVMSHWVNKLARYGYNPLEIASLQTGSLTTYELYRKEALKKSLLYPEM